MRAIAALLVAGVLSGLLLAQSTTSLRGTITDPTGAVVPKASVTLINDDTSLERETVSDSEGRYSFPQVQPGRYHLAAKAQGFSDVAIHDIRLLVSQPAT